MGQQAPSSRILAATITFVGLGMAWLVIVNNLPSQQELSAKESLHPIGQAVSAQPAPEPVLDLSIPGVAPTAPASEAPSTPAADLPPAPMPMDSRMAQV
ncbi:MAG TPA: hypothetical protein VFL19_06055, partial [Nitrospira sp.]|nr:hypothetical protein [Nitrospira sp.]